MKTRRGFTLIEMLLVITIILILAGLLLPAIRWVIRQAQIQKAQTTVFQLATAMRALQAEYGVWPGPITNSNPGQFTTNIISILTGEDPANNPRRIMALSVDSRSLVSTGYRDPWGSNYWYSVDVTYVGKVTEGRVNKTNVPAGVIVWSERLDGGTNVYIGSW